MGCQGRARRRALALPRLAVRSGLVKSADFSELDGPVSRLATPGSPHGRLCLEPDPGQYFADTADLGQRALYKAGVMEAASPATSSSTSPQTT